MKTFPHYTRSDATDRNPSSPLISVVAPVYNPEESIYDTIQSVLNQTYKDIEFIIVDDGSESDVVSMINRFKDKRIAYYRLEHKNANEARNYGISKSKGKYIAMLDADDIWLENHLEDCLNTLHENGADGLYGSLVIRYGDNNQVAYARNLHEGETMVNYLLQTGCGAQSSTLFMTIESAKNILWDNELNRHQDYDFVVRYSKKYKMVSKQNPTVIYLHNPNPKFIDFQSCMRFIKNNRGDIDPQLYNLYHQNMLPLAKGRSKSPKIIKHYIKEATRHKKYLSYYQYFAIIHPVTWFEKLKCKLEYIFHILK
jgi:glycosyltransferase involved in cell wall biosynthesis